MWLLLTVVSWPFNFQFCFHYINLREFRVKQSLSREYLQEDSHVLFLINHEVSKNLRGVLFPPSGNLPNSGIEPSSPALHIDSLLLRHQGNISGNKKWQHTLVFLLGKFYGQRSLGDYSPGGCRVGHDWAHICML